MLEEALSFWNAIKGKVREAIREDTRNVVRMERYDVTTAPNGTKIGVSQPFGDEIFVPYSAEVANAQVGDTVLLVWWNSLSTAKAYYFGEGYNGLNVSNLVTSVDGRTGDVNTFFKAGGSASTYPSTYGRFAVTANIFSNIRVEHYYGLLTIEAIGNYQRHMFESSWGEVWVGWRESSTVAEPTVWNKVAGGIGNSVRQVFASTDSAGWYRLAVMNDQITSAVIHLHATGWWEEDLYILIGRNYVSSTSPPSITIFGNCYNTRASQFRLNEISSSETYLEAYITPTNAHQLTITPFLTGWNRAYAVPKALSSSTGTIWATIDHKSLDTIETSGKIAGALRPTSVAYANIDSITETGFYLVTGTPGLLIHEQWDANYATQIFHQYTIATETIRYRVKRSGTWGSWRLMQDSVNTAYAAGDTYHVSADADFSGFITSSATSMQFSVVTPKSLANISTVSVTVLGANVRQTNNYIDASGYSNEGVNFKGSSYTVTAAKKSDNLVTVTVKKSSAFTNATNNAPVSIGLGTNGLTLSFS